jgi:hypothetical protein
MDLECARLEEERARAERSWKASDARAEQAQAERDEISARLATVERSLDVAERANAELRRGADDGGAALDAVQKKLNQTVQMNEALSRTAEARVAASDAARERMTKTVNEAEARADAAVRERDALAAELETARGAGSERDSRRARLLKAASERIRALELLLAERDHLSGDEVDLRSAAQSEAAPLRRVGDSARRYAFPPKTKIHVDREVAELVDLSITGAQLVCATSPEVGRIALVTLPSEVAPCFGQARLLWARREPAPKGRPQRYRVGLMFTDVDQTAIEGFINAHSIA